MIGRTLRNGFKLLLLAGGVASAAPEIFVSPTGDDAAAGTRDAPVATLRQARDLVRRTKGTGGGTVTLRAGTYRLRDPLELTAADSGTAGNPVVYRAAPGETVRLFGGTFLPRGAFRPVRDPDRLKRLAEPEAGTVLLEADLAALGIPEPGELRRRGYVVGAPMPPAELYIGGERQRPARWPNTDTLRMAEVIDPGPKRGEPDFETRGGTFRCDTDRLRYWTGETDLWVEGIFHRDWQWSVNRVAAVDPERGTLTLRYGEVEGLRKADWIHDFFHIENAFAELDSPGEYFIDRTVMKLYLIPPATFDAVDPATGIWLSALERPMLDLRDTSHVVFRDLSFDTGRNLAASCRGGESVVFERCEITRFGLGGLTLDGRGHGIRDSRIAFVGGRGVVLRGGDEAALEPGNLFVENCEIREFGLFHKAYHPGIDLWGVGNRVTGSLLSGGPHYAIGIRGNDHLVEYNEFDDVGRMFDDMCAIYGNLGERPLQRGHVIRRNLFRDLARTGKLKQGAVYADNLTAGWRIEENLFLRIGNSDTPSCWAVMSNGGSHIVVRHNVFVDCVNPFTQSFMLNAWAKSWVPRYEEGRARLFREQDIAAMPHAKRYPELLGLPEEDLVFPDSNVFAENVVWNPTVPRAYEGPCTVLFGPPERVTVRGNLVADTDPGFVDAAGGDFRPRQDSLIRERIPGFPDIPFERMGLHGPVGPHTAP